MKVKHLGLFLLLAAIWGCSVNSPAGQVTGSLHFKIKNPRFQLAEGFGVHAIPADTRSIQVKIAGTGLPEPRIETLNLDTGTSEKSFKAEKLPLGEKTVTVYAFNDVYALASDTTRVMIVPGETTRAVLELKSILKNVTVMLSVGLPQAFTLNFDITGEGILPDHVLHKTIQLGPGESSFQLSDLPLGAKVLKLAVPIGNESVPLVEHSLTVLDGETTVSLALADRLKDLQARLTQEDHLGDLNQLQNQIQDLLQSVVGKEGTPLDQAGNLLDREATVKEGLTEELQEKLQEGLAPEELREKLQDGTTTRLPAFNSDGSDSTTEGIVISGTAMKRDGGMVPFRESDRTPLRRDTRVYGLASQFAYDGEDDPKFTAFLVNENNSDIYYEWPGQVQRLVGKQFQGMVDLGAFSPQAEKLPNGFYTLEIVVQGDVGGNNKKYQLALFDLTSTTTNSNTTTVQDPATTTTDSGGTEAPDNTTDSSTADSPPDTTTDDSSTGGPVTNGDTSGGTGGTDPNTAPTADPRTYPVTIDNSATILDGAAFSVDSLSVKAGDSISWLNNTQLAKIVSSGTDASPEITQGNSFEHLFQVPGTYLIALKNRYGITLDSMTVTVTVTVN